ncbi:MAG: hypothetical protein KJ731_01865 [Alphaproteobacteria bacterium]|uniref:Uncharacterized protein n=1 Tax=viral metagenome TaxID=1070528 RepID=A0A6M3KBA7_9ZZZZ|nr:hypothetical protein [Alphaproteobacteria bacterium]MBU1280263.1 hypothetical protein [Alphaproteobacteria bacterium]MBU1573002.1 hypothetical protein [Alphaproteobacteria bacterium]MBU1827215.1 hypothetical protein [Alphaproteobacteria bacterium]MBU2079961.1 hypothetical protein [Alphaproteobacteria bacterium]
MKKILYALAVATAAVIIGTCGLFIYRDHQEQVEKQELSDRLKRYESLQHEIECKREVAFWDNWNRDELVRKYGDYAETHIDSCRWLYGL